MKISKTYYNVVIFISLVFFLFEGIQIASINTLMPFIQKEFSVNITSISMISSVYFFSIFLMLLPAGIMLDKYGPWKIYPIAFAISAVGMFVFSYAPSFTIILLSRIISGMAASFALIGGIKIVRSVFGISKTQFFTSLIISSHMCGNMIAQLPLILLIRRFGWRESLSIISLVALIIAVASFIILKKFQQIEYVKNENPYPKITPKLITEIISNRLIWLSSLIIFMFELPILMLGSFFGYDFLSSAYDINDFAAGGIFSLLYLTLMISTTLFGYLWKKTSHHLMTSMIFSSISLLAVIAIFYIKDVMCHFPYLAFIILGISSSVRNVGYFNLAEHSEAKIFSLSHSFMLLIIVLLITISRPLLGFIMKHNNGDNIVDYQIGGLCLILCLLIGMVSLYLSLKRSKHPISEGAI